MATPVMTSPTTSASIPTEETLTIITEDTLRHLPPPVRRYLKYTGVVGKPWIETVRLKYTGKFRMASDKPWMPIRVQQFYTTTPPSFWWKARFNMAGVPFMFANDVYKAGHGHMVGKVAGLFTVVDGQGDEIDQGTMVRYLQEMMWFPIGYLGKNITWAAVDDHAADVTFTDSGKSVTGRIYVDEVGRLLSFEAQRYGSFNEQYVMHTWATPTTEYARMAGLNLPIAGLGVWRLPDGDFSYVDVCLTEVVYNEPIPVF